MSGNHRLDSNKAERARAEAAGVEVAASVLEGKPVGPLRMWPGGLAMSRSLGDHPVRAAQGVESRAVGYRHVAFFGQLVGACCTGW